VTSTSLARIECPASFWCFFGAVAAGSTAGAGTAWLTRKAFKGAHQTTQDTAATLAKLGAFWLVGGLTWAALARRGI